MKVKTRLSSSVYPFGIPHFCGEFGLKILKPNTDLYFFDNNL